MAFLDIFPSILGTLTGGILGLNSAQNQRDAQTDANQSNLQIANANNATNIQLQQMANDANLQLAQQQNQWNIDQWNRENEYNSPSHQVQLLRDAGLNPAMASVGFQPASSVSSADLANQGAAHIDAQADMKPAYLDSGQIFDKAMAGAVQAMNASKIEAEKDKARAESSEARALASYYDTIAPSVKESNLASAGLAAVNAHTIRNMLPFQQNESDAKAALYDAQRYETQTRERMESMQIRSIEQDYLAKVTQNKYMDAQEAQRLRNLFVDEVLGKANAKNAAANAALTDVLKEMRLVDLKSLAMRNEYDLRNSIRSWKNAVENGMYAKWRNKTISKYGYDPAIMNMYDAMYKRSLDGSLGIDDFKSSFIRGTGDAVGGVFKNLPFLSLFKLGSALKNPLPVAPQQGISIGPSSVPGSLAPEIMY